MNKKKKVRKYSYIVDATVSTYEQVEVKAKNKKEAKKIAEKMLQEHHDWVDIGDLDVRRG